MTGVLVATLLWTGALLALVLLIRRPVAALFGARAAYALWALPMARLLLPPIVLPAWLAPAPATVDAPPVIDIAVPAEIAAAPVAAPPAIDWSAYLVAAWLLGAALVLARRYTLYFRMRRELLADARPMGEAGRVRLVETPAADGPVAFGVIDKVIALPVGFMAGHDRAARDLALAHEFAHHRGHDLLVNMLIQPLFALHWFTPLGRLGWQALRRDQEAACDARVMAHAGRETRAAYAAVIARFALQPRAPSRLILAAPMACPVLGDRSIVHRLKGLAMTDISPRRRWLGRALMAGAAAALPLTGSISYAAAQAPAPNPPTPPAAPASPAAPKVSVVTVEKDGQTRKVRIERRIERSVDRSDGKETRVERRTYFKDGRPLSEAEGAALEKELGDLGGKIDGQLRDNGALHRERGHGLGVDDDHEDALGVNGALARELGVAVAQAHRAGAEARAYAVTAVPRVVVRCRDGQREVTETTIGRDGRETLFVCQPAATAQARRALALARSEIARSTDLTDRQRREALRSIQNAERELRTD